jgi:class 3 adenylate cyclase
MGRPSSIDQLLKARAEIDKKLLDQKTPITILFTDIVDSTAYFDRYGDTAGLIMIRRLNDLVRRTIEEFKGRVIKEIGDAVMAEFWVPAFAARAAVEIQRRLARLNQNLPEHDRLLLRIGINEGKAFRDVGDVFGDLVNVASRIIKETGPAQILVSSSLRHAIFSEPDLCCIPKGTVEIKGKSESQEIFELTWCVGPENSADLQSSVAGGVKSDGSVRDLQHVIESRWKWILAGSIAVAAIGGFIVQHNLPKIRAELDHQRQRIECGIFHSCPTPPAPPPPDSTSAVTVADSLPLNITLDADVPSDGSGGQILSFTVLEDFKAGDTVVIPKGAKVRGSIMGEVGKKVLGIWRRKMKFLLMQADAVNGQKLNIRATAGHAGKGPASRPFDTGKGYRSKELAAAKGTEYVGYTDGQQTVSVRK